MATSTSAPPFAKRKNAAAAIVSSDEAPCPLQVDMQGWLRTTMRADSLPLTAFGEIAVACKDPEMQLTFPNHLDPHEWSFDTAGGGHAHSSNDMASVMTTTATDGMIRAKTRKHAHYHAGQGIMVQFSAIFPTITEGHTFAMGLGNENDGVFFGSNGTSFGILRRKGGVDVEFIPRASWDDPLDGTGTSGKSYTHTNGNVYFIQVMWHGMGNLYFYVFHPDNRQPTLVHTIKFADSATETSFANPALPLMIESIKTSGASNLIISTASMAVFSEGVQKHGTRRRACQTSKPSIDSDTETVLMTLRNRTTVLGVANPTEIVLNRIAVANEGSRVHIYRIYRNCHVNTTSFVNVHECSSIGEYDISASSINSVEDDTAQTATAETITLAAGASGTDDYYTGRVIVITGADTGVNQCRTITSYNGTTKAAEVMAWRTTPTGTITYTITNGVEVGAITTAKDNAHVDNFDNDTSFSLSPGETITITVETAAITKARVSFAWNEKI
jgi:hypothetical protein